MLRINRRRFIAEAGAPGTACAAEPLECGTLVPLGSLFKPRALQQETTKAVPKYRTPKSWRFPGNSVLVVQQYFRLTTRKCARSSCQIVQCRPSLPFLKHRIPVDCEQRLKRSTGKVLREKRHQLAAISSRRKPARRHRSTITHLLPHIGPYVRSPGA